MNCKQHQAKETTTKIQPNMLVKPSIINLTDIALTDHQTTLSNLRPNFVPAQKRMSFVEIITATESVALNLGYHNEEAEDKSLRQNVCHILNKNRCMKIKDHLSKEQRKALKEIQQINNNTKVYLFDKGSGSVVYRTEMQLKR